MNTSPFIPHDYSVCPYCHTGRDIVISSSDMSFISIDPEDGTANMVVPMETIYRAKCTRCDMPIHPIVITNHGGFIRFRFAPMEGWEINEFLNSLDLSNYNK